MAFSVTDELNQKFIVEYFENGQYLRLGKYVFLSGSFFNLIRNIADYPDLKSGKITGMDFDKYWYDNNDNIAADGNSVSVKISKDERRITIGDYQMDTRDFNVLSGYVIKFAKCAFEDDYFIKIEPAIESLKKSSRPMLIQLQDDLFSDDITI